MRAILHESAIGRPFLKLGIVRADGHEARFSLSISTVLFKRANAWTSLRLPSGFTTKVRERAIAKGDGASPFILIDAPLGHTINETHFRPERLLDGPSLAGQDSEPQYRLSGLANAVGMRPGAGQLAAIDDQVLLANRATLKPAFKDLPGPGCVAGLSGQ